MDWINKNHIPVGTENLLPKQMTVAISGVASGIGHAQAVKFLKAGHSVFGIDLKRSSCVNELLDQFSETFFFSQGDVSEEQVVKDFFARISRESGFLHVLCNTAGQLDAYATIEDTNLKDFIHYLNVNLVSVFLMTKYALPLLLSEKSSRIINMTSIAGLTAGGGGVSYTAAKHAICGITKQMAYDYSQTGLRVNAIAPGAIATEMNRADFEENNGALASWVADETPIKRWASAEEVADLTFFLASNQADYIQGAIIPIDGGWLCR